MTNWALVIELSRAIAEKAHFTQLDKTGQPYIGHPARVAANARNYIEHFHIEEQVTLGAVESAAWLHDVIEDSGDYGDQITEDDLRQAGIPDIVVDAVLLLTDDQRVPDTLSGLERRAKKVQLKLDYYARINANEVARIVKLADLADNNNAARTAAMRAAGGAVDPAKYPLALAALALSEAEWAWFSSLVSATDPLNVRS